MASGDVRWSGTISLRFVVRLNKAILGLRFYTACPKRLRIGRHLIAKLKRSDCSTAETSASYEIAKPMRSCRVVNTPGVCCDAIFKRYPDGMRRALAPCIAAFLLSDPKMVEFVVNWNDRNFSRGTGSPRVRGSPCFADVGDFASYMEGTLEMNGWTLDVIRAGSFRRV